MNYSLLFSLLLTHALSDFVFQSAGALRLRTSSRFREVLWGNCKHLLSYALLSMVLLIPFWAGRLTAVILAGLVVSHGLIDFGKSCWIYWRASARHSLGLLFFDQSLHVLSIIVASYLWSRNLISTSYLQTVASEGLRLLTGVMPVMATPSERWLLASFLLVIGLWGAGVFIRQFLQRMNYMSVTQPRGDVSGGPENTANSTLPDGGFVIGLLERFFIILAIVLGREEVIGFVLATKSVARFKKFDEDRFMEYFIIGSFLSFTIAISLGAIIKALLALS